MIDFVREIERSAAARGAPNISFFALLPHRNIKTLQVWRQGTKTASKAISLVSMRQDIEKGLSGCICELRHMSLLNTDQSIEEDRTEQEKSSESYREVCFTASKDNWHKKTEIIMELFRDIVSKEIRGKEKPCWYVVRGYHTKRYFEEFGRYIKKKVMKTKSNIVGIFGEKCCDYTPDGVSEPE